MKSEKDEINSELKAKFAELFDEVTELKAKFAQQAERAKLKQAAVRRHHQPLPAVGTRRRHLLRVVMLIAIRVVMLITIRVENPRK